MFHAEKNLRLSSLIDLSKPLDELAQDLESFNSDYISISFNVEREILECASEIFSDAYIDVANCSDQSIIYYMLGFCILKYYSQKFTKSYNFCKELFIAKKPDKFFCDFIDNK